MRSELRHGVGATSGVSLDRTSGLYRAVVTRPIAGDFWPAPFAVRAGSAARSRTTARAGSSGTSPGSRACVRARAAEQAARGRGL